MKTIRTFAPLALALALACGGGGETPSEENGAGGEEVVAAPRVTGAEARQLVADGALLLDVTPERTQGAWFHFDSVREADRAAKARQANALARRCAAATGRDASRATPQRPDALTPRFSRM